LKGRFAGFLIPTPTKNPEDIYIIAEDPSPFEADDDIYVVNLKDLQRNIKNPIFCQQIPIAKNELGVVADNLQDYIKSLNEISY
jgi:hypothetical protein